MLLAYPGCPSLSRLIAMRVTNPYEDQDAFISVTGRKGIGKSTMSSALCEDIASEIAILRGKGESPEKFFNINHVRSISELGALEMLSGGALTQENSVFLLDDTGTQWSARNFQSPVNKTLNAILQICRVYKCVIVANFILQSHIDIGARGMADFRAEMQYKNTKEEYAVFKFYYLEQGTKRGKPHEYKKYLKWHNKRITQWVIGKPSDKFLADYKVMRRENTDGYIAEAKQKMEDVMDKLNESEETKRDRAIKNDKRLRDYDTHPEILRIQDEVIKLRGDTSLSDREKTDTAIARKVKSTRHFVGLVPK
jgi:hypothetical protein